MRSRRRNDNYVATRVNSIINSIPTNPFIGFSNTVKPIDQTFDDWDETDYTNDPYEPQK
ncbi:MAG: hypothetical protein K0R50_2201 [Eubacterium sp.]|jgi:Txe/YoeB family toxin of Txe-Axe toxin-antitoxin module|nr:hypothetical protein [Eubacterium sp.]